MSVCLATLQLIRSSGIGPVTFHELVGKCGSAREALAFLKSQKKEIFPQDLAEKEIKESGRMGISILDYYHEHYPKMLKNLPDFPPVISVMGNVEVLNDPMIGIVGSRAASLNGTRFTHKLAISLGDTGYVVISGLARGIDGAAHKGALDHITVAVVAGGVDVLYPPEHKGLRSDILKKGAVVSEMPLGLFPGAKHFPRRNRLISAMGLGVCVIEAAKPSGSLITASYALDQGKEVFAVPGFPGDTRAAGTNYLLKQGAHVLEGGEDVLNILGTPSLLHARATHSALKSETFSTSHDLSGIQNEILKCLSSTPVSVEDVLHALKYPQSAVYDALTRLELEDHITRDKSGYVSIPLG